eukprot:CAMPEP_0114460536 /NCGR_PEP_ID=MMETSP0104-20121206/5803_1 /TAXON_ID=37642 ORGANISM="Paraphysomonas imperforata, Strain PA2" /NCGR_SAMPLE_ID=MMETSP0104 /ASSEMBLY_ACC=CAM_ASM_000202 /LENGTH=153 /DNA_ID=CAMNT_0001633265 /DNA_START=119 /DNA_END=577 /DNA_ORIENTATION=-
MSKEQQEEVQQSVDCTLIRVGRYELFTTRKAGNVILAEASELRAFWEALFPSLTKEFYDKNKWCKRFTVNCQESAIFTYVRDMDERSQKKGFHQVLPSAVFYPVIDVVWFVKYASELTFDELNNLHNLISSCIRLSNLSSSSEQQSESDFHKC